MNDLRLIAEPEWLIANIVEYVAACICAATVGMILAICFI